MKQRTLRDYSIIALLSLIGGIGLVLTGTGPLFERHFDQLFLSLPLIAHCVIFVRAAWRGLYRMTRPGTHYMTLQKLSTSIYIVLAFAAAAALWLLWRLYPVGLSLLGW